MHIQIDFEVNQAAARLTDFSFSNRHFIWIALCSVFHTSIHSRSKPHDRAWGDQLNYERLNKEINQNNKLKIIIPITHPHTQCPYVVNRATIPADGPESGVGWTTSRPAAPSTRARHHRSDLVTRRGPIPTTTPSRGWWTAEVRRPLVRPITPSTRPARASPKAPRATEARKTTLASLQVIYATASVTHSVWAALQCAKKRHTQSGTSFFLWRVICLCDCNLSEAWLVHVVTNRTRVIDEKRRSSSGDKRFN